MQLEFDRVNNAKRWCFGRFKSLQTVFFCEILIDFDANSYDSPIRVKRELAPDFKYAGSDCIRPASLVPEKVIPTLYRIVYWSTQLLTWFLIPFLSAYVQAGEFTILAKARTALIDNAIYYGTYLVIFVILLIYAAASKSFHLNFGNLKTVGISAANTWGLFLLGT